MGMAARGKRRAVPAVLAPRAPLNLERSCHHCLGALGRGPLDLARPEHSRVWMLWAGGEEEAGSPPFSHQQGEAALR